eukprot:TRINITY_DN15486_c0_g1_i1.p2 TRINITY_DN15486_c0_g1~~TRINITY_DN15486_c0_g1_i1.p2  ORF type:complete len:358 (-),score=95.64 TRINITY_DN15486_c0_g1_i1:123-1196(-)
MFFFTWLYSFITRTITLIKGLHLQMQANAQEGLDESVGKTIDSYVSLHDQDEKDRTANYAWFVNAYYNVSTVFYEWAWGRSFHFAPTKPYDTFQSAILRHEMRLADKIGIKAGDKVLDVGCGIGGPLSNIALNTGGHITGLNNNSYQVSRGNKIIAECGLDKTCNFIKGDFCHMPLPDASYDKAYAIESTCHAPSREDVFAEIYRVLKPGGVFGVYEWVLTDKHDPSNPAHALAAKQIEIGNGLPATSSHRVIPAALKKVGFEVLEDEDFFANRSGEDIPWYINLTGSYLRPSSFQFTPIGRPILVNLLAFAEKVGLAPVGVCKVSEMLHTGGVGLVAGGKLGTFTPGWFFLARKPL